jgi:hypothetical protein
MHRWGIQVRLEYLRITAVGEGAMVVRVAREYIALT